MDRPNGETRLCYARMAGHTVVALVQFTPCDPVEGEPCFNVGWAVAEAYWDKEGLVGLFQPPSRRCKTASIEQE